MDVFVSFDWDHDKRWKFLLNAWDRNPAFRFSFSDNTPSEIQSSDISRVKAAITRKINAATHTLVIVGQYANSRHRDAASIGYTNWINFEVAQSKASGNRLVGVKLDRSFASPSELLNAGASWANAFEEDAVIRALREA